METVEHYQELATKAGFGPATTIVQASHFDAVCLSCGDMGCRFCRSHHG